jgi:hypothetical protein
LGQTSKAAVFVGWHLGQTSKAAIFMSHFVAIMPRYALAADS